MLNEVQKDRLGAVDDVLLQSLLQAFTDEVEKNKPVICNEDNMLLGEKYRAYVLSQTILEGAFNEIRAYRTSNVKSRSFNKER